MLLKRWELGVCWGLGGAEGLPPRLGQVEMFPLLHTHELVKSPVIYLCIYLFNKHLLYTCLVPDTVLGVGVGERGLCPERGGRHTQSQDDELE